VVHLAADRIQTVFDPVIDRLLGHLLGIFGGLRSKLFDLPMEPKRPLLDERALVPVQLPDLKQFLASPS
jgi:hypothetical protein